MIDHTDVGNQILLLRKQNGLTQEKLAEQLGVSSPAVSKWENGHTLPETALLPQLAKLLHSTVDAILAPDDTKRPTISVLSAAKQVYRVGDIVERPAQPWSPTVGRFLRHLENMQLPVERIVSLDEHVERAEFFQGEMVHPKKWTDDALHEVGQLVARLHNAAKSFVQTDDDVW